MEERDVLTGRTARSRGDACRLRQMNYAKAVGDFALWLASGGPLCTFAAALWRGLIRGLSDKVKGARGKDDVGAPHISRKGLLHLIPASPAIGSGKSEQDTRIMIL